MSSNVNFSTPFTPTTFNPELPLRLKVGAFIGELEEILLSGKDPDFSTAEQLLINCLSQAASDPRQIAYIRQAIDDFNAAEKDNNGSVVIDENRFLKYLIKKDNSSLVNLLIDLKIKEIFQPDSYKLVLRAVKNKKTSILTRLLQNGVSPNPAGNFTLVPVQTPLYVATVNKNSEYVALLLQAGADPNTPTGNDQMQITPFEQAFVSNNLNLASIFFLHSRKKIDTDKARDNFVSNHFYDQNAEVHKKAIHQRQNLLDEQLFGIAKKTPPLPVPQGGVRCFFRMTDEFTRNRAKERFLDPLYEPDKRIEHLIAPIAEFAKVETRTDPKFDVIITPQEGNGKRGTCNHNTGKINIFFSKKTLKSNHKATTLLHEISHRATRKLGWNEENCKKNRETIANQVSKELNRKGKERNRKSIDPALRRLRVSSKHYSKDKYFDEYIARTPQAITDVAKAYPNAKIETIEKIMNDNVPTLYSVYKNSFLPKLNEYNRKMTHKL